MIRRVFLVLYTTPDTRLRRLSADIFPRDNPLNEREFNNSSLVEYCWIIQLEFDKFDTFKESIGIIDVLKFNGHQINIAQRYPGIFSAIIKHISPGTSYFSLFNVSFFGNTPKWSEKLC